MKNLKQTFVTVTLVLMGLLTMTQVASAQEVKNTLNSCSAMVYLKSTSIVKLGPANNSKNQARFRKGQYLCVLDGSKTYWKKVAAVPFVSGKNTPCDKSNKSDLCGKAGNYPIRWYVKPKVNKTCQLKVTSDSEDNLMTQVQGVCATGWVRNNQTVNIAD